MSKFKGYVFITLASLAWSSAGLFIKLVSLPAAHIAMYRSLIAGIFLFLVALGFKYFGKQTLSFRPTRTGMLTAIFYTLTVALFVMANKLTTSANAVFMQYTSPVYVILISFFILKEKILAAQVVTVSLCLCGMSLFFMDEDKSGSALGTILAVLSGVSFALLQLTVTHSQSSATSDAQGISSVIWGNAMTTVLVFTCATILMPLSDSVPLIDKLFGHSWTMTGQDGAGLLFLGVIQLGLGYLFFLLSAKYLSGVEIAIYTMLEPIANPFWTFLGTGEKPGMWAIIGAGLILVAMTVNALASKNAIKPND